MNNDKIIDLRNRTVRGKTLDHRIYRLCKDLKQEITTDREELAESPEVVPPAERQ
jgi:hypothetical protein